MQSKMQREVCEHEVFSVSLLPQTSLFIHSGNKEVPLLKAEEQQHPHGSIAKPSTLLGHSLSFRTRVCRRVTGALHHCGILPAVMGTLADLTCP